MSLASGDKARAGGCTIFWVLVSSCYWDNLPLAEYQAALPPSQPLERLPTAKAKETMTQLVKQLANHLQG